MRAFNYILNKSAENTWQTYRPTFRELLLGNSPLVEYKRKKLGAYLLAALGAAGGGGLGYLVQGRIGLGIPIGALLGASPGLARALWYTAKERLIREHPEAFAVPAFAIK